MLPALVRTMPRMAFSRVVLPAPLGPTTHTISPGPTVSSMSWIIGARPYPPVPPVSRSTTSAPRDSSDEETIDHLLIGTTLLYRTLRAHLSLRHTCVRAALV